MRITQGVGHYFTALKTFFGLTRVTAGGQETVVTTDLDAQQALNGILKQMKIMNIHLELITGENVKKTEVE